MPHPIMLRLLEILARPVTAFALAILSFLDGLPSSSRRSSCFFQLFMPARKGPGSSLS